MGVIQPRENQRAAHPNELNRGDEFRIVAGGFQVLNMTRPEKMTLPTARKRVGVSGIKAAEYRKPLNGKQARLAVKPSITQNT